MSDVDKQVPLHQYFHNEIAPKIDSNTRTVIVARMNHNGESEVIMGGQDLDMAWLLNLARMRLDEIIASKKNED